MLLDSNIVIYATEPKYVQLRDFIARNRVAVSVVTHVEVLGFHRLARDQENKLRAILNSAYSIDVSGDVIQEAIVLRQQRRMRLGDSLIAATALIHGLALVTHNSADFGGIDRLTVIDPLT